jgi:hypothetical protein
MANLLSKLRDDTFVVSIAGAKAAASRRTPNGGVTKGGVF